MSNIKQVTEVKYEINNQESEHWGLVVFTDGELSFINCKVNGYKPKKALEVLEELVGKAKEEMNE